MNKAIFNNIKDDFPIFSHYPNLIYLDNAATSQKPKSVINAVSTFYQRHNANIHRGIYSLSQDATHLFEQTRNQVAQFIGVTNSQEIVFTGNASEAINVVAYGWARKQLQKGDIIITTEMEHHSNIVPWQRLKDEIGIQLVFLPIGPDYKLDYKKIKDMPIALDKIKLLAISQASNVLGVINPINEIITYLRQIGVHTKVLVDAAQSIPHLPINVNNLGCDFLVFSSHKMLGPSGVGVLWGKKELLLETDPFFVGSHMIRSVTKEKATWADLPDKFETGTRNLEGVIGLGAAIKYLQSVDMEVLMKHELDLTDYSLQLLQKIKDIKVYGPQTSTNRLGVFSFNIANIHAHDVAEILNRHHIAVRSGHHCAQTVMQFINEPATIRASFYLYNTKRDIEKLIEGIENVKKIFSL